MLQRKHVEVLERVSSSMCMAWDILRQSILVRFRDNQADLLTALQAKVERDSIMDNLPKMELVTQFDFTSPMSILGLRADQAPVVELKSIISDLKETTASWTSVSKCVEGGSGASTKDIELALRFVQRTMVRPSESSWDKSEYKRFISPAATCFDDFKGTWSVLHFIRKHLAKQL